MKLKAVLQNGAPEKLIEKLQSDEFREEVLNFVLAKHLHVLSMGPAEFYVQKCDFAGTRPMCEARLTGVSATPERTGKDFLEAREALQGLYYRIVSSYATSDLQLMVSIMADSAPEGLSSPLIEREGDAAIWIRGSSSRKP